MFSIDWADVGEQINNAMLSRGLSSEFVAAKAGVDRKTVDRIRRGNRVRVQTLSWIEKALGLSLLDGQDQNRPEHVNVAPAELGGYARDSYGDYPGSYFMFRNSYDFADRIICSYMQIYWDIDARCLKFRERQNNRTEAGQRHRYDFVGRLSIPPGTGIVQFIVSYRGMNRIITTTSLRGSDAPYFRGVLTGINEISDVGFYPATTPVFILRQSGEPDEAMMEARVGSFALDKVWRPDIVMELREKTARYSAFH